LLVFIYAPRKALVVVAQRYQNTRNFIYLRMHSMGDTLLLVEPEKVQNIFESFRNFTRFFFIEAAVIRAFNVLNPPESTTSSH